MENPCRPSALRPWVFVRPKELNMAPSKKPEQKTGTFFPVDPKGERSTTYTGKEAIAAALRGAGEPSTADSIAKVREHFHAAQMHRVSHLSPHAHQLTPDDGSTKDHASPAASWPQVSNAKWRFGYNNHYMSLVRASCGSPEAALGSAKAGLAWMYDNFEHVDAEGSAPRKFKDMLAAEKGSYTTGVVKGAPKAKGSLPFVVPYDGGWSPSRAQPPPMPRSGKTGDAIKALAGKWVGNGIIEPDAGVALNWTVDYFDSGKNLNDCYFVLIGAGSAMGPCSKLLEMGGNVVAIDIPGKWGERAAATWTRLFGLAAASPGGSLIYPIDPANAALDPAERTAGADLMAEPGKIANWLVQWQSTLPKGAKVCVGNYTYLDGDLHVKLALCADACIAALQKARPETAVAFLCTPTDIHACTRASHSAAKVAAAFWHKGWAFEAFVKLASLGKWLVPNALKPVPTQGGSEPLFLVDGLSVAQGPNYALAKRMQVRRFEHAFTHPPSRAPAPHLLTPGLGCTLACFGHTSRIAGSTGAPWWPSRRVAGP